MKLKDELTAESVRLEKTIKNGNDLTAIKAARTRWENKHRAYWERVKQARKQMAEGAPIPTDVDPLDLAEVTVGD